MRPLPRAAVAAAILLAATEPGAGYLADRTAGGAEVRWDRSASAANVVAGKVTFYIAEDSAVDVTPAEFAAAVRLALQSWDAVPHASIGFLEDDSRRARRQNASDRVNRIGYQAGLLPPLALGATFAMKKGTRIVDADLVLNPVKGWAVSTPGEDDKVDVQAVVTHEWGHAVGIGHSPLGQSTMYYVSGAGLLQDRSLETDDRAALVHLYPAADSGGAFGTIHGTVTVAGATDVRGVQVTAIDCATGLPAVSAFTDPEGNYSIDGLPPGLYRVVASPVGTSKAAGGVFGEWFASAPTVFLPSPFFAFDASTGLVPVAAGETVQGIDLDVAEAADKFEPNDTRPSATPFALGHSLSARIETGGDEDWYSFTASAGRVVSVYVHAGQLGSDLNPRVSLRDPNGIPLAANDDIRPYSNGPEGYDTDARVLDVPIPGDGTYYVRVEAEESIDTGALEDYFYVLTILETGTVPVPWTSTFSASPAVIYGNGTATSVLTFTPRTVVGSALGPGREVTMDLDPDADGSDGSVGAVTDEGDGTYTAVLTAPASVGSDTVRALVDGWIVSLAAVTYVGPVDADASGFSVAPRRIRFDGASVATATLVPRDAGGSGLGPGRTVVLSLAGTPVATIGPTTDGGSGTYTSTVVAGTVPEPLGVTATVDGVPLGVALLLTCGFPLEEVVDDAAQAVGLALGGGPPPKAAAALGKASVLLSAAADLSSPADDAGILDGVRKGLKRLEVAAKKGASGLDETLRELVEAAREAAMGAVAAAEAADPEGKLTARARSLFATANGLLDAGRRSNAAGKFRAALLGGRKVAP